MTKEPKDDPILEKLHHQLFHLVQEISLVNMTLKESLEKISKDLSNIVLMMKNDRRF